MHSKDFGFALRPDRMNRDRETPGLGVSRDLSGALRHDRIWLVTFSGNHSPVGRMSASLAGECSARKDKYDNCFLKWYSESRLCFPTLLDYRLLDSRVSPGKAIYGRVCRAVQRLQELSHGKSASDYALGHHLLC